MRRFILLCLCLVACSDLTAPTDVEPFEPPPIYTVWWHELETCTGHTADMGRITWFKTPGGFDPGDGDYHHGIWTPPHNIYLDANLMDVEWLVKHEMLHDLVDGAKHDHPMFRKCDIAAPYYLPQFAATSSVISFLNSMLVSVLLKNVRDAQSETRSSASNHCAVLIANVPRELA